MSYYQVSVGVYLVIAFAFAMIYSRKNTKSSADFFVGGRKFGTVFVFFTMMATFLGAATTIGTSSWVWVRGFSQIWTTIGYAVVFLFLGLFLASKVRRFGTRTNAVTFADFLEMRYSKSSRFFGALLMGFAFLAIAAFQYIGVGRIITTVTGMDYTYAVLIAATITILYTAYGGMMAIAITGVIKGGLIFCGIAIMTPILYLKAGGWEGIAAAVPTKHFSVFGYITPMQALTWFFVFFLGIIPMQDWWQRVLSAKGEKEARRGLLYMAGGFVLIEIFIFIIGFSGKVLEPTLAEPEQLFPILVMKYFHPMLGGLLLAALIAIITSTASACLLVVSTHFTRDLYCTLKPNASDETILKVSKFSTFGLGVLVLIFVFAAPSMFGLFIISADILGASMAVPILAGFFAPQVGKKSGLIGMVAGVVGWFISYIGWEPFGMGPVFVGAMFSLISIVICTFIFPPVDKETLINLGLLDENADKD